ncbi:hypothetical protein [Duganella sp. BuS-21]|uniref:hypothetical protein n=1 Tax=Duganella sp. BuS-21 TaxID=2943848 RepID=UPI0035A7142B
MKLPAHAFSMRFLASIEAMLVLVLVVLALVRSHFYGDGQEYWLTTVAFAHHGDPIIRPADFEFILQLPQGILDQAGIATGYLKQVETELRAGAAISFGFAKGNSGTVAIHFWLYSALVTIPYIVGKIFHAPPAAAFTLLNVVMLLGSASYIRRTLSAERTAVLAVLVLSGGAWYVRWTGPEVMSAALLGAATAAALRHKWGTALLCSGIAASQNPSIIAFYACVAMGAIYLHFRAHGQTGRFDARDFLMALIGGVMAFAPYIFNAIEFGVPSLIAVHYTRTDFMSARRFLSALFDLNQGMLTCLPGLAISAAALLTMPQTRRQIYGPLLLAIGVCLLMLLPTLATINWNSGHFVLMRYGYWCCIPVVIVVIDHLRFLTLRSVGILLTVFLVFQILVTYQARLYQGGNHLQQTAVATWFLDHMPSLYNPDPEIFFERETHVERMMTVDDVVIHEFNGRPTKVLIHSANRTKKFEECDLNLQTSGERVYLDRGWLYLNAPFACLRWRPAPGRSTAPAPSG